jgi:hypothetical protein
MRKKYHQSVFVTYSTVGIAEIDLLYQNNLHDALLMDAHYSLLSILSMLRDGRRASFVVCFACVRSFVVVCRSSLYSG